MDTLLKSFLESKVPAYVVVVSLLLGIWSLVQTPREEEPQIVVPMIDVVVTTNTSSAREAERLVTTPLEKLLSQVPGVKHVYSITNHNQLVVTLRFEVGQARETALLNTYNKLNANIDAMPSAVERWQVKPQEVDDVPIVVLGLWSKDQTVIDDFELRRFAQELSVSLQSIDNTSEVKVIGGRPRQVEVALSPEKMAALQLSVQDVIYALQVSNQRMTSRSIRLAHQQITIESGDVFADIRALELLPIKVINQAVVKLKDIAVITDGPAPPMSYTELSFTRSHTAFQQHMDTVPFVAISIAKQPKTNAVDVAQNIHQLVAKMETNVFPEQLKVETLRDYGETANDKVNNLTSSLLFAVITVVVFIWVFLGWRAAVVVGLAIPICYGLTLFIGYAFGYTINRVTLFALILSLGLLVDDPIAGADNITRFISKHPNRKFTDNIVGAISEIKRPLILSTVTIVLAFLPLAFITGMMGPYMAPMAFNVPLSIIVSTLIAFLVTPWLAKKWLKQSTGSSVVDNQMTTNNATSQLASFYRRFMLSLMKDKQKTQLTLLAVGLLFITSALLPVYRVVPLKLLPFDNKNELQILIEMPTATTLEQTYAMSQRVTQIAKTLPEVKAVAQFVGISSPHDFNGLVRQYYLRNQPNQADLRLILIDKTKRIHHSHDVLLRLRAKLAPLNGEDVHIKVVEVPPGPPVMSTLVAEVTGIHSTRYDELKLHANTVAQRMAREPHIVEVDTQFDDKGLTQRFVVDKTKAALSGVSTSDINQVIELASHGLFVGRLWKEHAATEIPIQLSLAQEERSHLMDLTRFNVRGREGFIEQQSQLGIVDSPIASVPLSELGHFVEIESQQPILHKDLNPIVYVIAELSGRTPASVIADISADFNKETVLSEETLEKNYWADRTFINAGGGDPWQLPDDISVTFSQEGEWKITLEVFRDMGIAFCFALVAIYLVLRFQTQSVALSLIIMSAIPLTIIGIMPGFWILNQLGERELAGAPEPVLFTATAMIGMIALAGIVVRNSLILVEFITQSINNGMNIEQAAIEAGVIRMRPVLLTAGTTLLGNMVITLDPVFSGLAIAIIFGIFSSTLFTLILVPVIYVLVFRTQTVSPNQKLLDKAHS